MKRVLLFINFCNRNQITKVIIIFYLFVFHTSFLRAQTTLSTGDVAFTSYSADNANDSFSIILLQNISSGTQIIFTDGAYADLTGFLTLNNLTESSFTWSAPNGGLSLGQQITFWRSGSIANASTGSIVTGDGLDLSSSGDQIFASQSSTILAGIHFNFVTGTSASNWDNNGVLSDENQSDLPNVLTNGTNALYFASEPDNARYNCTVTACSATNISAAVNDTNYWLKNDTGGYTPSACQPTTTTWNGTCWTNFAPTAYVDAIIASTTAPGSFTSKDLTINSSFYLTINSSDVANTAGNLLNNGNGPTGVGTLRFTKSGAPQITGNAFAFGGIVEVATGTTLTTNSKLTIGNGGSLMHGTSTTNGGGSISGSITLEKNIGTTTKGWRLFSLPVQINIDDFENGVNTLCDNYTPAEAINVYEWNATVRGGSANNVATGWEQAPATDNQTKSYSIYLDNASHHTWDFSSTVSATGIPNDGTFNFPLAYTFDPLGDSATASQRGWNLLPNPYPSNLSATALINSSGFGPTYKAVHVWDNSLKQFKAINANTLVNYHTDGGSIYGNYAYIPPFMAFWVKADADLQQIDLTNASRTGATDSLLPDNFMKTDFDIFRLTVADKDRFMDQLSVCFDDRATTGMDYEYDLYKMKSTDASVPTLYTIASNNQLSLSALPLQDNYSLPVFMESYKNGTQYTFSAEVSQYKNYYDVFLTDNKTGQKTNLLTNTYAFDYDKNYAAQRFTLDFGRKTTGIEPVTTASSFCTYTDGNGIHIKNIQNIANITIEIYNTIGQLLFTAKKPADNESIYTPAAGFTQVYFVCIITNGTKTVAKVIY